MRQDEREGCFIGTAQEVSWQYNGVFIFQFELEKNMILQKVMLNVLPNITALSETLTMAGRTNYQRKLRGTGLGER